MNRLRQMSIFAHIVEEGSVSAAAVKLDLSKSVISQHLKTLEQELNITLMKRTTRSQQLTDAGKRFYQSCKEINTIADSAWEQIKDSQIEPKGRLKITAPNALMDVLVVPVVADLMIQYPKVKPELISDDKHLNLMKHNIDLAIRVGTSPDSSLKQKRLGEFRDVLCGSSKMKHHEIESLPYIANHWQGKYVKHTFTSKDSRVLNYEKQVDCMTNSFHSCLSLIEAGAGIALIPEFYLQKVKPDIINLLPEMRMPLNPVYALTPYSQSTPLAVDLCIQAIEKRLQTELL